MTEFADLVAAITARPGDDTPRLIAADWLDDRGEHAYASFIRDQIQLHHADPWDGFAIRARHQRKVELTLGLPYRSYLPVLPHFLHWHPEKAFRRGFGSGVIVRQLSGLIEAGQHLFDLAPIDELWLGPATLDEWRHIARSPWLMNVRKVHLMMTTGLIEPVRCLAESPYALNIDEIWFDTLATPAAGTVMEALVESKLAPQLEGLHLRLVPIDSSEEVSSALILNRWQKLRKLSLIQCEFESEHDQVFQLFQSPWAEHLLRLNMSRSINQNLITIRPQYDGDRLEYGDGIDWRIWLDSQHLLPKLRELRVCENANFSFGVLLNQQFIGWRRAIRSISLSGCRAYSPVVTDFIAAFDPREVREIEMANVTDTIRWGPRIDRSEIWNRLRILDLSGQGITFDRRDPIADIPVPPELEALILSTSSMPPSDRAAMDARFGDRIVWQDDPPDHGLSR